LLIKLNNAIKGVSLFYKKQLLLPENKLFKQYEVTNITQSDEYIKNAQEIKKLSTQVALPIIYRVIAIFTKNILFISLYKLAPV